MDYSFFDGLIDGVFVINSDKGILYCNEAAAKLCDSSVRRLAKAKPIYETITLSDDKLFTMPNGEVGKDQPTPYVELNFTLKSGKTGKVQVAIQPFAEPSGDKRWAIMLRDVTLEEILHAKYHLQLQEKEVYIQQLKDAQKQLEDYSKNLEKMVAQRTQELNGANVMLNAIMDSLGQGFFVFDKSGDCANFYTRACEDILETVPAKKKIWDVLKVKPQDLETFHMWHKAVFDEQLPFDTIKELGPSFYNHSQERSIKLDYFPLRVDGTSISSVVVVATDKTSEYLANKALEKEKKYAKMIIKLVTGKRQFTQFLANVKSISRELKEFVQKNTTTLDHEYVFRVLHTLEGEAATFSVMDVWASARQAQECLEPLRKPGMKADLQKVRAELISGLDHLRETYDAFLESQAELFATVGIGGSDKVEISVREIEDVISLLEKKGVSISIRNEISDLLLREPVSVAFKHFQDIVSVVAGKMNKEVNPIQFIGSDTKIYLEPYKDLFSSFVHAFRNAVDHGIESPEDREMSGKNPEGTITVKVEYIAEDKKNFRIIISDDGRGISAEALREKLAQTYSKETLDKKSDFEIIQHVFDSGVSTKTEVGEFSGRGIGMNAIKAEAEKIGGKVWVETEPGKGSKLFVELPDLQRVAPVIKAA
jgi:two-component system, chemotaxis family, sensor kinase CheA